MLTISAELGPVAAVISELRDRVRAVELERAAERARTGRRVLGRRAVLAQSWRASPASIELRRNHRPRIVLQGLVADAARTGAKPDVWTMAEIEARIAAHALQLAR